jgi:hypothetical protein
MKENSKIELELSEEQLHTITGGCGDCDAHQRQADDHLHNARLYGSAADHAWVMVQNTNDPHEKTRWTAAMEDHSRTAAWHADQAAYHQQQVIH